MEGTRRTLRPLRLLEELDRLRLLKTRTSFGIPEGNGLALSWLQVTASGSLLSLVPVTVFYYYYLSQCAFC